MVLGCLAVLTLDITSRYSNIAGKILTVKAIFMLSRLAICQVRTVFPYIRIIKINTAYGLDNCILSMDACNINAFTESPLMILIVTVE